MSVGNKRCYIDPVEWERETASILRSTISVQNKTATRTEKPMPIRQTKSGLIHTCPRHGKTKAGRKLCLSKNESFLKIKKIHLLSHEKNDVQKLHSNSQLASNVWTRKININKKETPLKNTVYSFGLSSKEKNYIILKLQSKSSRYTKLKDLAAKAKKENKIFCIYGTCNAVRKALTERGWVEKIPPYRMNLAKIKSGKISNKANIHSELERLMLSNLVEKCNPNFVWRDTHHDYNTTIDMKKECKIIVNKLKTDALWTTKEGLCSYMKINYWFYIEDVAEVTCPRTYNSFDNGELDEFVSDYKLTACTSLLQWIICMRENDVKVNAENGTISLKVMTFALNRCKEYLFEKRNKDIDQPIKSVSTKQWNTFLKKYYRLITKKEVFETDRKNMLPQYMKYAQLLLQKLQTYRPEIKCEGYQNIWIIKPGHWSRGRGIRMASKLGVITDLLKANSKYVVQKYIEKPMLIYETKFDIRQYYLVTSTYPLVIWMYKDCYLKFSSQKYNLENYHESIHLTNNAVQKKYNNYDGRHPDLPMNNMWELNEYKNYLNKIGGEGVWEHIIYPGMKKSIIGIMLSGQDSLPYCKNRFELYGCDFLLDEEYTPWLIEINSCPDLTGTTEVTAKICPVVVDDVIKVVIDNMADPKAPTGNFECIYQQPMTVPRFSMSTELSVRGMSLPSDYFFKGSVALDLSDDMIDSNDENDILLNKLRLSHSKDSIDDFYCNKCSSENVTLNSSTMDLIRKENVKTSDIYRSPKSVGTINYLESKLKLKRKEKSLKKPDTASSLTIINSLFNQILNQFSSESKNISKQSSFDSIDDKAVSKLVQKYIKSISNKTSNKPRDYLLQATSQIVSFINSKEKQYYAS
ncbi:tubulin glycylase 3A-like [Battus philenor]|uniref:tubulin glycylase 3A-like n=1 Tax=Battus philenor TaxID=42288 RepID=UPI0035CF43B9